MILKIDSSRIAGILFTALVGVGIYVWKEQVDEIKDIKNDLRAMRDIEISRWRSDMREEFSDMRGEFGDDIREIRAVTSGLVRSVDEVRFAIAFMNEVLKELKDNKNEFEEEDGEPTFIAAISVSDEAMAGTAIAEDFPTSHQQTVNPWIFGQEDWYDDMCGSNTWLAEDIGVVAEQEVNSNVTNVGRMDKLPYY